MIPSALTIATGTSQGRRCAASETKCAPSAKSACTAARGLEGESCLADPTRPGEGEQPDRSGPQLLADRGDVLLATDRPVGRHRQPAVTERGWHWRPRLRLDRPLGRRVDGRRELGGVPENVLVQIAQPLSGLDAELLHEPGARGLEGRQRVGLPPAAIERQHLQLHEALLEGMRDDQRVQLAQELAVAAQLEVELDPLDDRGQALLLQARALGIEQTVRAHSPERLAAPETKRLVDPLPSGLRLTARARAMRLAKRLLPAVDIALARLHIQQIAVRLIDQPAAVSASLAQRLAQARDMHLQAYTRSRGRVLAPQLVD